MTPRKNALVWRLAIPVVIALLPLSLAAQNGARTPDEVLKADVGTDPTNSIRLYHALNGLGKTTALYLYPLEDHGPVAKETLLDLWARWGAWLEKYVKNPQKAEPKMTNDQALVVR